MALHGTIEVNGERIGWWSAQNVGSTEPPSPTALRSVTWCRYRYVVDLDGDRVEGEVVHARESGAAELASIVLEQWGQRLSPCSSGRT